MVGIFLEDLVRCFETCFEKDAVSTGARSECVRTTGSLPFLYCLFS